MRAGGMIHQVGTVRLAGDCGYLQDGRDLKSAHGVPGHGGGTMQASHAMQQRWKGKANEWET